MRVLVRLLEKLMNIIKILIEWVISFKDIDYFKLGGVCCCEKRTITKG